MESVSALVRSTAAATELVRALSASDWPGGAGVAAAAACAATRSAGVVKLTAEKSTDSVYPLDGSGRIGRVCHQATESPGQEGVYTASYLTQPVRRPREPQPAADS